MPQLKPKLGFDMVVN